MGWVRSLLTMKQLTPLLRTGVVGTVRALDGWLQAILVLVTLVLFAIAWPTLSLTHEVETSLLPVVAALEVAPLLLVRYRPFLGWAASVSVALVVLLTIDTLPGTSLPWSVVHFLVILALVIGVALQGRATEIAITAAGTALLFGLFMPEGLRGWAFAQLSFIVVALLVRWLALSRRQLVRESRVTEDERERRAAAEERTLIARELHDIVAHHMSLIVVQAQSAPYRLEVSDEAREEFSAIEASARSALDEVRSVLGVLRRTDQQKETAPVPGAADVVALMESARAAGLVLTWHADRPALGGVPPGPGLAAYRIVQESLANASRHAPGAAVRVDVAVIDGGLQVTVDNGPATVPDLIVTGRSGGSGLIGMRTRAESADGTFRAGPTTDGGFSVHARIPLTSRAAESQPTHEVAS